MTNESYIKTFANEDAAADWMRMKNQTNREPNRLFVLVDGPDNDWAVVDIKTAIELGGGYRWEV